MKSVYGETLRELRQRKGLTQQAVADAIGVHRTSVTNVEGGRDNPSTPTLLAWAELLGATVWLGLPDDAPPSPAEREVLGAWAHLDDEGRQVLLGLIRRWSSLDPTSRAIMKVCATNPAAR